MHRFRQPLLVLLTAGAALPAAVGATPMGVLAYTAPTSDSTEAWLVDWGSGGARATVVTIDGARGGAVSRVGDQNVISLDAPYSQPGVAETVDPCIDRQAELRVDTLQFALRRSAGTEARGTSQLLALGTVTTLTGCNAGQVTPFGSLADAGRPLEHLSMSLRPPVTDLLPTVSLAGPSDEPRTSPDTQVGADVLTLQAGGLASFARSARVVPASINAEQWLVLGLPGGERAYARLAVDRRTGAETWLDADWEAGAPSRGRRVLMVKPLPGAGFGTARRSSRIWESGLFIGAPSSFSVWLYGDLTGERVSVEVSTGVETRAPITWSLTGDILVQRRTLNLGETYVAERSWKPLATTNRGRSHFVMEEEVLIDSAGIRNPFIAPRVSFYNDLGPATRP